MIEGLATHKTMDTLDVLRWTSVKTVMGVVHIAYQDSCPAFVSLDSAEVFCAWVRSRIAGPLVQESKPPALLLAALRAAIDRCEPYEGPVNLRAQTPFQSQVLAATRTIPCGQTRTYGELAALVGRPRAARAVGTVLANNPLPFLIPCHRVVASGLRLGQYSDGGPAMKRRLLEHEGVDVLRLRY